MIDFILKGSSTWVEWPLPCRSFPCSSFYLISVTWPSHRLLILWENSCLWGEFSGKIQWGWCRGRVELSRGRSILSGHILVWFMECLKFNLWKAWLIWIAENFSCFRSFFWLLSGGDWNPLLCWILRDLASILGLHVHTLLLPKRAGLWTFHLFFRVHSSMGERLPYKQEVVGSNPSVPRVHSSKEERRFPKPQVEVRVRLHLKADIAQWQSFWLPTKGREFDSLYPLQSTEWMPLHQQKRTYKNERLFTTDLLLETSNSKKSFKENPLQEGKNQQGNRK